MRVHLFPSRTQKLSSSAPTILGGRLPGKIGNANTSLHRNVEAFFLPADVHRTPADGRTILGVPGKIRNANTSLHRNAVACLILAIASRYWFHKPEIAFTALLVFFAIRGSNDIALCAMLKEQKRLIRGIVEFGAAVAFAVALVMIML